MRLALDANRYVDFMRGEGEVVRVVQRASQLFLPLLVLAELRAGFRCGRHQQQNEAALSEFLRSRRVTVLLPDEGSTHVYAHIFADLRRAGTPIPINDLWIAALVIQHGLVLCTRDRHFDALPQIPRI